MRLPAVIAVGLALVAAPTASARVSQAVVPLSDAARQLPVLERLGLDVTHDVGPRHATVILYSDAERERLTAHGFVADEVIADVESYLRDVRSADGGRAARQGPLDPLPSARAPIYRVPSEYSSEIEALVAAHPGLVRRVVLGRKSVEDREIEGVEIAKDVNRADDGRPVYVVIGLHHAREWPSGEVTMEFAHDLAKAYGTDARITALLDNLRVYLIPVTNPDGFLESRGNVSALPYGSTPLKRRNCRAVGDDDPAAPCLNKRGVDMNRNYGAYWGGNGASTSLDSDTYRGPAPWSEPETQAIHEFSQRLQITNFQSIHNIAALVLRPPGFKALGLAPDEVKLKALGDAMGAATGYSSEYGYQLYEVTGATEDWNYVAQNAFGYTIELGGGDGAPTFQGPYQTHVVDQYLGTGQYAGKGVREALLLAGEQAARAADHAIIEGIAPAGRTLRLRKDFATTTSPICQADQPSNDVDCAPTTPPVLLPDFIDTTLVVPADGRYRWHVTPSTRPFERKAGRNESWTLSCEDGGVVRERHDVVVGEGQVALADMRCDGSLGPATLDPPGASPAVRAALDRVRLRTLLRRGLRVRLSCSSPCTVTVNARLGKRTVARRSLRVRSPESRRYRIPFAPGGRQTLRARGKRHTLRVVFVATGKTGGPVTVVRTLRLR